MPTPVPQLLACLHDALESDGGGRMVADLYAESRFPVLSMPAEDAFLDGLLDRLAMTPSADLDRLVERTAVYARERSLVLGFLPLTGRRAASGRTTWCAPLWWLPATLVQPEAGQPSTALAR